MAAIFQMTFSNALSWMKMYKFCLKFHLHFFPGAQLTIFQHWLRYLLGAIQATSHYVNQWWLVYWRIYVSLGLNELKNLWNFFYLMMTLWHWNFLHCMPFVRVIHQWCGSPHIWSSIWSSSVSLLWAEQAVKQTVLLPVIRDPHGALVMSLWCGNVVQFPQIGSF